MPSSSHDVQLQIRRDAEDCSAAHQDLMSWIDRVSIQENEVTGQDRTEHAIEKITAKEHSMTSLNDEIISLIDHSQCDDGRLRGNSYFAQGMYQDAIACYTRCLGDKDALATPLVYSNCGKNERSPLQHQSHAAISILTFAPAMAHLKLKCWLQAEADATSALLIDPLHFKSYQRRCVARLSMGKVRAAMQDICAAMDAATADDSAGESVLAEIQQLRSKIERKLVELPAKCASRKKLSILPLT